MGDKDKLPRAAGDEVPEADHYLARVAKYIPSEIIVAFVFLQGVVSLVANKTLSSALGVGSILLCAICTPLYLRMAKENENFQFGIKMQTLISTCAFLIWAYVLGGAVMIGLPGLQHPAVGSFMLVAFTLIAGFFRPKIA